MIALVISSDHPTLADFNSATAAEASSSTRQPRQLQPRLLVEQMSGFHPGSGSEQKSCIKARYRYNLALPKDSCHLQGGDRHTKAQVEPGRSDSWGSCCHSFSRLLNATMALLSTHNTTLSYTESSF